MGMDFLKHVNTLSRASFYERVVKNGLLCDENFSYAMSISVEKMPEEGKDALRRRVSNCLEVSCDDLKSDGDLSSAVHAIAERALRLV